jgi:superfamily II RNA helicase
MYQTSTEFKDKFERIDNINAKLNDRLFSVKKKERLKLEKEINEIKEMRNFKLHEETYKTYKNLKKELYEVDSSIWNIDYGMLVNMDNMKKLLIINEYMNEENEVNKKGIIASCISEVNELILSEAIYDGYLDYLEFEEIVAILSCLFNEKDPNSEDKYLSSMEVSDNLKYSIDKLFDISNKYKDNELNNNIFVGTDMEIYLDFVEPVYIWAKGGTFNDVYRKTQVYEGNFVKLILRINNIMMNLKDIFTYMEKYDLLKKIENYEDKLLRNEASVNSIYIDGL